MMPTDVDELDVYIKKEGWLIIDEHLPVSGEFVFLNSLHEANPKCFLVQPEFLPFVDKRFLDNRNIFYIGALESPAVEYCKTYAFFDKGFMRPGRLYYKKVRIDSEQHCLVDKDTTFLKDAADLFKWYKKHFPNQKLQDWTTPRTAAWVKNENGKLLLSYQKVA